MRRLNDVGEVTTDGDKTIHWVIPRLLRMPNEMDTLVVSPYFFFRGEECGFILYPNGCSFSFGWLGIECGIPSIPDASDVNLSMIDRRGREVQHTRTKKGSYFYTQFKWIPRSEVKTQRQQLLPGGKLHIVCKVFLPGEKGHTIEEVVSDDEGDVRNSGTEAITTASKSE